MKTENTYIPQFDYEDIPDISNEDTKFCVKCGKETLTLYDGYCFDCKKEIGFSPSEMNNSFSPNWDLYNSRIEQKIESYTTPFALGVLWKPFRKYGISLILCLFALSLLIASMEEYKDIYISLFSIFLFMFGISIQVFRKKLRRKKFCNFNKMTIEFWGTNGWVCPCCGEVNYSLNHCKTCGVRPTLIVSKEK